MRLDSMAMWHDKAPTPHAHAALCSFSHKGRNRPLFDVGLDSTSSQQANGPKNSLGAPAPLPCPPP